MPVSRWGTRSSSTSRPTPPRRTHLAGGAGEPGSAHVLNADDGAGLHGFKAGFEKELLHEGIADLDIGTLGLSAGVELFAGHGGAVDAVAAGLCSYIDDGVARAAGLAVEDFVDADQAEGEGVDQRVAAVAGLELGFAAEVGDAETVAVAGDAADYAFDDGVVLGRPALRRSGRASWSMGPKRSESMTASGRAPMVKMSRRMPPTPVAAP